MDGILSINKPLGLTSRDVVNRVTRMVGTKRVGHAGTLDPAASGVLVVAIGRATRLLEYVLGLDKTYEARVRLGAVSNTDDSEGEVTVTADIDRIDPDKLRQVLTSMIGQVMQRPPAFSAIKRGGKRAYELARKGETVVLSSRPVRIDEIEVTLITGATVGLRVRCGQGVYIRSIARDLGEKLGVGGYLTSLCRTAIGHFVLEESVELTELERVGATPFLLPMQSATSRLPIVQLDDDAARRFDQGLAVDISHAHAGPIAVIDCAARLVGIGRVCEKTGQLRASKAGLR